MKRRYHCSAALAAALVLSAAGCGRQDTATGADAGQPWMAAGAVPAADAGAPQPQAGGPAPALPPIPPPPDTSHMQPAQIVDTGFGQPLVAADLQVPAGWQVVGGIGWHDSTPCVGNQMQLAWSAIAPDSLTAIEKLPGFTWQVAGTEAQFNPCPSAPFQGARQFLEATATRLRPGWQLIGYEDLTGEVMRQVAAGGGQAQGQWDAGRLTIAYSDAGGVPMHEALTAAVGFSRTGSSVVGGTAVVDAHRAPAGRLDLDLVQRVGDTMRLNPQWTDAMRQRQQSNLERYHAGIASSINDWHQREMAAINARGMAERHAIRMRTSQEVGQIYGAIAANTSATSDRMHATTMSGIGEYNRFQGVGGTEVRGSIHGGSRMFQDTSDPGRTFSTSDPYARAPSGYVELQRVP